MVRRTEDEVNTNHYSPPACSRLGICTDGIQRDGTCPLKFEEEVGKEAEVERSLVLDVGGKR